jgi:hypothetical protein
MNRQVQQYRAGLAWGLWRSAFAVALLSVIVLIWHSVWAVGQGWYYSGWSYRRSVTITNNTASALTDYQVLVSLTSANFDFSHAQSDGSDIRFTYWNGALEVEIPYWIEQWNSGTQQAKIWTKVPSVPASGNSTIYLYYGNPNASSASSGKATFDIFEDFSANTGEWTEYDPNNKIELDYTVDHRLEFNDWRRHDPGYVYKSYLAPENFVAEFDMTITGSGGNGHAVGPMWGDGIGELTNLQNAIAVPYTEFAARCQPPNIWPLQGSQIITVYRRNGDFVMCPVTGPGLGIYANSIFINLGTVNYVRLQKLGNSITLSIFSDPARTSHIPGSPATDTVSGVDFSGVSFTYYYLVASWGWEDWEWTDGWTDNYKVRKYTEPEPTASVGAEEFVPMPIKKGDVNDDSKINTIDARMAQQHADGVITLTGNQFLAADVDQDSDVDSADATGIAKKGIGLPTGIPGFARGPHPRPLSVYGEGWPQAGVRWLFLAFTLPALALLRRHRRLAVLLLVGGLSALTGCVEFAGLAPPSGAAIYLTSTSMPNGATRTIDLVVQQITTGGGVASLQGRITFPAGVAIQSLTGLNGFVVKASCGTVGDPCPDPNELRLSLVKPSAGGVSNGAVLRVAVQASGAPGQVYTLSWSGNAQAPIVLGSDANVEITGFTTGNGQVKVQ